MRTLLFFTTTLAGLFFFTLSAQLVEDTVKVIAYWSAGDTAIFNYRHEKFEANFLQGTRDSTLYTSKIAMRILEENPNDYLVEWIEYDYKSEEFIEQFIFDASAKAPSVPFRYQTNELGNYDTLLNFEELKRAAEVCVDTIAAVSKLNEGIKAILLEETNKYYQSQQVLEQSNLMIPLYLYHLLYGKQYKLEDTIFYQDEIVLSGDLGLADAEAYIVLTEIDTSSGFAYFSNLVEPNTQVIKRQTAQQLINNRKAGKSLGPAMDKLSDDEIRNTIASLEFLYYIERGFTLHYDTGYMVFAKAEQVIKTSQANAESWETVNVKSYEINWDFDE